jgi:hypothetical protein
VAVQARRAVTLRLPAFWTAYAQACWACWGERPIRGRSWDSWPGLRCLQFANNCVNNWAAEIRWWTLLHRICPSASFQGHLIAQLRRHTSSKMAEFR